MKTFRPPLFRDLRTGTRVVQVCSVSKSIRFPLVSTRLDDWCVFHFDGAYTFVGYKRAKNVSVNTYGNITAALCSYDMCTSFYSLSHYGASSGCLFEFIIHRSPVPYTRACVYTPLFTRLCPDTDIFVCVSSSRRPSREINAKFAHGTARGEGGGW